MKKLPLFLLLSFAVLLVACGGASEPMIVSSDSYASDDAAMEEMDTANYAADAVAPVAYGNNELPESTTTQNQPNVSQQRLIIKNGEITIEVADAEAAADSATNLTVGVGGYLINKQVFSDGNGARFATMRLGVPSDQFEATMRAISVLGTVVSESNSGIDVTDEFVDLNSRLDNLTVTRDRLRGFLDEAATVEEALDVNRELSQIEEQMNVIQGRVEYLADRAAFSTIDLMINPTIEPMLAVPTEWTPGETLSGAIVTLKDTAKVVVDAAIYFGIVLLPWIVLIGVPAYFITRRFGRRNRVQSAPIAPAAPTSG